MLNEKGEKLKSRRIANYCSEMERPLAHPHNFIDII